VCALSNNAAFGSNLFWLIAHCYAFRWEGAVRVRVRVSRVLITNTLCAAVGVMLAVNITYLWEHWGIIRGLWEEVWRCVERVSH